VTITHPGALIVHTVVASSHAGALIIDHVDWRGRGGCVLAPPSRHASGRIYRWLVGLDQVPLPEVAAALRALLEPSTPGPVDTPTRAVPVGHPCGRRVLADELAQL
jgi:hypothetical protein